MKNHKSEQKLSEFLNFTSRQMFWITYGSTMCEKSRSKFLIDFIDFNKHSLHEFRVNGPLSNIEEFSEDFKCHAGFKMSSEAKCTVW